VLHGGAQVHDMNRSHHLIENVDDLCEHTTRALEAAITFPCRAVPYLCKPLQSLPAKYIFCSMTCRYTREDALKLLASRGPDLHRLYEEADTVRREQMGDDVFVRGIIEFSNVCRNRCLYCGINATNVQIRRYTMSEDEILAVARSMAGTDQATVVLQAGESPPLDDEEIGAIIRRIKRETGLAITLSVGNRPRETYRYWRDCGMDRYLLRFETSNSVLFTTLHPGSTLNERLDCIQTLKDLGVQTGSGFMIGLPGETVEVLAANIVLCRELDLDMIGIGPFIPHPDTPLGMAGNAYDDEPEMFFKALAVLRIFNPDAHIPATTAYDTIVPGQGRDLALQRGANIFMPNDTPLVYKKDYLLYPGKPYVDESGEACLNAAVLRIHALGRRVGKGPGHSVKRRGTRTHLH
jgi:biotin synthase